MTTILRIKNVNIIDSSNISVSFTESLTPNLTIANVSILSQTPNSPNSQVLEVTVSGNDLNITCQPLTPYSIYYLQFQSVDNFPFISVNGDAKISQDGVSNKYLIIGPLPSDNAVMNYLQNFYQNNIYRASDSTTIINSYLQAISINFARALYDIRQVKNENYLSFTITDEFHTRGPGPFDRLYEESAYDVFRVGFGPTKSLAPASIIFSNFPDYPVTLQRQIITETITTSNNNSSNSVGTFNVNTLTFTLNNNLVSKVDSIIFTLTNESSIYNYNIDTLGYQLLDSTFDPQRASSYLLLQSNQVKLNDAILKDPNFAVDQIFNITIIYEYRNLGIQVDNNSVNVFTTLQSVREVIPPIINIFNLQHAPITDISNNTLTVGGVTFTDPNSNTGANHPAFLTEVPFSLSSLPSSPGIYSIDYSAGTVYVFGATSLNDGTGPSPPLATYYYKYTYISEIDYVYDQDSLEIVALPLGNLVNNSGTVKFNYEQVLVPGIDYNADSHIESINERVGNRLSALNSFTTLQSPITNVFQIYNETSGEIYLLDRWNNNIVYFTYNIPPRILQEIGENTTFNTVTNEVLSINNTNINSIGTKIFTIFLANNTIINSSQDGIGSSINTSVLFTNGNVFVNELWFDNSVATSININKLHIGQYVIDYNNGVVYVGVSNTQNNNIGTITYKINDIVPNFPHVISVDDIYYRINILNPKNKQFSYTSFSDGNIIPSGLDNSDEGFLNKSPSAPYQIVNGQVGAFVDSNFIPTVTNQVNFVRGLFDYNDLINNISPLNFANVSKSNNYNITVGSLTGQSFESVQFDGSNYFVTLNVNLQYLSAGINYNFIVVRNSDSSVFSVKNIVAGNPVKLILNNNITLHTGDLVNITYNFSINNLERVIVDYNKGDLFVDYTYVADEILISYEYGDNILDFRQNTNLSSGTGYYVSYKVGALRDALLKNFGTLINISDLSNFDLNLPRERYREALQAALSSFIQGPTINAIKNLVQIITHVEPQIIESSFNIWSLGRGFLSPGQIETSGNYQLLPAHYSNGVLINQPNQTITMPVISNLRLEEGTFSTWILPQWNGLDNDASLSFIITRDGYAIDPFKVFIGAAEYHPTIDFNNTFTINKLSNVLGTPNTNKDGIFIYYDNDPSGQFKRWYVEIIDGYVNFPNEHIYKLQIISSGKFYNVQPIGGVKPSNMTTFTGTNKINLTLKPLMDGYGIDEGLTFISDVEHYIMDFGLTENSNRLSIFKDAAGYINFRAFDKKSKQYMISSNISNWQDNQPHMISASWKLNTINNRDEMHLFIDGLEVPNIVKYGQALQPYLHEKFRTINPEEIIGLSARDIVGSDDLVIVAGSNLVSSLINFSAYNIFVGDTIFINENGFSNTGYTINAINGQTLTLNEVMPITLNNAHFSINKTEFFVTSEINIYPNIAVSTIHTFIEGNDLISTVNNATFISPSINFENKNVVPGFLLRIDAAGYQLTYNIISVSGNSITITDPALSNANNISFQIYSNNENELPGVRALDPDYSISQDANFDNVLTVYNGVLANDLILIKTLGLNFQDVKKQYYVWSSETENVLMTQLPPPIDLNQAEIIRIITPTVAIGRANSTLVSNIFVSNNLDTSQPSNSQNGRTIQATIGGTNVDFSTPVTITIHGVTGVTTISETITFNDYGTLHFANPYISLDWVQINVKPLNPNKNACFMSLQEMYPITHSEFSGEVPVVRYSYHITGGYNLTSDGQTNILTDGYNLFSELDVGNTLLIQSPANAAGWYNIISLSSDRHSIGIEPTVASFPVPLPIFNNGNYQVLNTTQYRSGLQNGFFTLENALLPGTGYLLGQGFYQLNYATYLGIKFDRVNEKLYIGSDLNGNNQVNAIVDQTVIYSIMLKDTRIGEITSSNSLSITKNFNSLKALRPNSNMLTLINFDNFPFINEANIHANTNNDHIHFQSDFSVNDNFEQSLIIKNKPILLSNTGILDTHKQGTIEFWMSPLYDTANDPNDRYYFDAYGAVVEEVISENDVSIKISSTANEILSVTLTNGDPRIDYFAGGKLEIDTQNAIQEDGVSIGIGSVKISQPAFQIITVKIVGDFTGKDYFANGTISSDGTTIFLGIPLPQPNLALIITYQAVNNKNLKQNTQIIRLNRKLPAQNCGVTVKYIPSGLQGDRLSIYKDKYGYINFEIMASGTNYVIRGPTYWVKDTWHRVKAQYQINGGLGTDMMLLYLDGYQYTDVLFGEGLVFGKFPMVMGSVSVGDGYGLISNITFKDSINNLWIGSDYTKNNSIFTLLNNFRISNYFRPIYAPYGEPIDVNFSNNLKTVFPVENDLYTTYLMNSAKTLSLISNFATLIDRDSGSFDFTINIFDSFNIVNSNQQVKQILENLINTLKPANTQVYIKYII